MSCLEDGSKVMMPLWDETARLLAVMLATEIDEERVERTTSLACLMDSMVIGRLEALMSRLPILDGREMVTSITRLGAVAYERSVSPPVNTMMRFSCCWMQMLSLSEEVSCDVQTRCIDTYTLGSKT